MRIRAFSPISRVLSRTAVLLVLAGCGTFIDSVGGDGSDGGAPLTEQPDATAGGADANHADGTGSGSDVTVDPGSDARPDVDATADADADADADASSDHVPDADASIFQGNDAGADADADAATPPTDPCILGCPTKHCSSSNDLTCDPLVFLSNGLTTGSILDGVAGADTFCTNEAKGGLGIYVGNFRAWLATPTSHPQDRLRPAPGPYRLRNGAIVAMSKTELQFGQVAVQTAINVNIYGNTVTGQQPWTGLTNANSSAINCFEWSSITTKGFIGTADSLMYWSGQPAGNMSFAPCNEQHPLYCFQDGP